MSIVSSKGMLVKRDLMSKLAIACPWLFFTWEISDANENESKIVNQLDVSGSSIGTRNFAIFVTTGANGRPGLRVCPLSSIYWLVN